MKQLQSNKAITEYNKELKCVGWLNTQYMYNIGVRKMERWQTEWRVQRVFMGRGFSLWMLTFGEMERGKQGWGNCLTEHQVCCRQSQTHMRKNDGTDGPSHRVLKATFKCHAIETSYRRVTSQWNVCSINLATAQKDSREQIMDLWKL